MEYQYQRYFGHSENHGSGQSAQGLSHAHLPFRGVPMEREHEHSHHHHHHQHPDHPESAASQQHPQPLHAQTYRYDTPFFFQYPPPGTIHPPPLDTSAYHLTPSDIVPPRQLNSAQSFESFSSLASTPSGSTCASIHPTFSNAPSTVASSVVPLPSTAIPATSAKTNWEPMYVEDPAVQPPHETSTKASLQPSLIPRGTRGTARSRRAAASKARSTIASLTTALRSPHAPPAQAHGSRTASISSLPSIPPLSSRPASAVPSATSAIPSPVSTTHTFPIPSQGTSNLSIPIHHPKKAPTMLPLRNHRGYLLPAPPDAQLEVNDLLILHPPALSPGKAQVPISQYNPAPVVEGYRSMYEMYTCRVCSKTYDGKNARSVARRHLQDKHGVPLAVQKRRTRWDIGSEQLRSAEEVREKTLKIKRDWASKARVIARLSKTHATFLAKFGPNGIHLPDGTHIVAASFKGASVSIGKPKAKLPVVVRLGWNQIPKRMREDLAKMKQLDLSEVNKAGRDQEPAAEDAHVEQAEEPPNQESSSAEAEVRPPPIPLAPNIHRLGRPRRTKNDSLSTNISAGSISSQSTYSDDYNVPIVALTAGTTPNSQKPCQGLFPDISESGSSWSSAWGAATHVDDQTFRIALAQHYNSHPFGESIPDQTTIETGVEAALAHLANEDHGQNEGNTDEVSMVSPDPLYTINQRPAPDWQASSDTFWGPIPAYDYSGLTQIRDESWQDETAENSPVAVPTESSPTAGPESSGQGGQVETTVAAESLLDLHSTPARPDDTGPRPAREEPSAQSTTSQTASSAIRGLLEAPEITPRPRPSRGKSFVQPFAKSRPDALTRSISFNSPALDDPFTFTPALTSSTSSVIHSSRDKGGKRRRPIASPSPLAAKRKKDGASPRLPALGVLGASSRMNVLTDHTPGRNVGQSPHHGWSGMTGFGAYSGSGLSGAFVTPVKATSKGVTGGSRGSTSKSAYWQLSSPGGPSVAASLGLLPEGGAVRWTPGMSGIVGSDTPAKKR